MRISIQGTGERCEVILACPTGTSLAALSATYRWSGTAVAIMMSRSNAGANQRYSGAVGGA